MTARTNRHLKDVTQDVQIIRVTIVHVSDPVPDTLTQPVIVTVQQNNKDDIQQYFKVFFLVIFIYLFFLTKKKYSFTITVKF